MCVKMMYYINDQLAMHHRQMSKLRDELTSRTSEVEGLVAVKAENEKKIQGN